jgi:predicted metal-binding membrane protein
MDLKKIILVGLIAGIASFIVGNLLYLNPFASSIYSISAASYCAKPMEPFASWIMMMFAGGILSAIFLTALYSFTEKGISKKPGWKKGMFFGALFWIAAGLPSAYNTWLLHSYPDAMIMLEAFNGLIGALTAGIVMGIAYEKIK